MVGFGGLTRHNRNAHQHTNTAESIESTEQHTEDSIRELATTVLGRFIISHFKVQVLSRYHEAVGFRITSSE